MQLFKVTHRGGTEILVVAENMNVLAQCYSDSDKLEKINDKVIVLKYQIERLTIGISKKAHDWGWEAANSGDHDKMEGADVEIKSFKAGYEAALFDVQNL